MIQRSIIFGWDLDGLRYPETSAGSLGGSHGEILGPQGLLELLENRFGLGYPSTSRTIRVAEYMARLRFLDNGQQFYSSSFESDAWATSSYLLGKRDQLLEAGWDANTAINDESTGRIKTFATLETADAKKVSPGLNERLHDVSMEFVGSNVQCPGQIVSMTPVRLMPCGFRGLISLLVKHGMVIQEKSILPKCPKGDLHLLQRNLAAEFPHVFPAMRGDGSFLVFESANEVESAEFVASWLSADIEANKDLVVIRGSGTSMLDASCSRLGLPRIGGERRSRFRGALQILPLVIDNLWEPFNPSILLQFLNLPLSPVRRSIARCFSESLRIEPGLGGEAWKIAWSRAEERQMQYLLSEGHSPDSISRKLKKESEGWRQWLEPKRFSLSDGIPAGTVIAVTRRITKWATSRSGKGHDDLLQAAAQHARDIAAAIDASGLKNFSKVQLERIIDEALGDGVSISAGGAEASEWSLVDKPGQLWSDVESLLWWGFVGGEERGERRFWSKSELLALKSSGVELDPIGLAKLRFADSCRKALNNVRHQIVLVKPRSARGQLAHPHQFWPAVSKLIRDCDSSAQTKISVDSAGIERAASSEIANRLICAVSQPSLAPPLPKRHWEIPPGIISQPMQESFTSMDLLLRCSFAWTLQYPARIRSGVLLDTPDGERLVGNLAHAVVAALFSEKPVWSKAAARQRSAELFEILTPLIAAPLLMPDKVLEYKRALEGISRATATLVELLCNAELTVIGTEVPRSMSISTSKFIATLDLLCTDKRGAHIIIDLKWSRAASYRLKEMKEGKSLQLAAYGCVERQQGFPIAGAGYFMMRQARLLYNRPEPFPADAFVDGSDLAQIWEKALIGYNSQLDALKSGSLLASGVGEANSDERGANKNQTLLLEPQCQVCSYFHLCGARKE